MKILFVAAEAAPFSKAGGLADVVAGLPRALRELGHDARILVPCHASSLGRFSDARGRRELVIADALGPDRVDLADVEGTGGVPVTLVRDARYFGRESIYGEPDDRLRYELLCRVAGALAGEPDGWQPDILHLHDWHTAPLAFGLRNLAWRDRRLAAVASVLTIHNLRYRGPDDYSDLLGSGIYYADRLTTVSPTYAREIQGHLDEGLGPLLRLRASSLAGILNGIDAEIFDPRADDALARPFGPATLELRAENRVALAAEAGLAPGRPVAAIISRLTEQKGIDLVLATLPLILAGGWSLMVLGSGDPELERGLGQAEAAHPGLVRHLSVFSDALARRIYGGADLLLMPSRFEPCGLGQMIAMRYGCVPLGHRTGGLADSIVDGGAGATGFLFDHFDPAALAGALGRAGAAFADRHRWRLLQANGMRRECDWRRPAERYVEVYRAAAAARSAVGP